MRYLPLLLVASLTFGCAAPTITLDMPNLEASSAVAVQDLRPASEKENKIFSLAITSEAYGTYRRGDKLINPDPVRLLQHKVYEKYAQAEQLPAVNVHHLVIYMNLKSELRRGVTGGLLGGIVGSSIAASTQKYGVAGIAELTTEEAFNAFDEEYKRALYTEEENPDKASVYKVYIDAEIDGKRVFVSTMTPTRLPEGNKNPHAVALETAIAYWLDQY